jgi:hypothetical protein
MTSNHPAKELHPRLYAMIETASRNVEQMFAMARSVASVWHYVTADGNEVVMLSPPFLDKDLTIALMRTMLEVEEAVAVLYFDEAWTFVTSDLQEVADYLAHGLGAADHPRRVEIVHFTAEDDTGNLTAMRKIVRHRHRPPELGPLEFSDADMSVGRMVGLLPRPPGSALQ